MAGEFYFIKDEFYRKFSNRGLMVNKGNVAEHEAGRPCFFSFQDKNQKGIYWFIPISSQVQKYEDIAQKNFEKYGKCDTLEFGEVLGFKRAFLIQNIFPATQNYISEQYKNNNIVVRADNITTQKVITKAADVLEKVKLGVKLTFTNVYEIYDKLVEEINSSFIKKDNSSVNIVPLRVYKKDDNGVVVKLDGQKVGEKVPLMLKNGSYKLSKDGMSVVEVNKELQQKYGIALQKNQIVSSSKRVK